MKLRKGKYKYKLPGPVGDIVRVYTGDNDHVQKQRFCIQYILMQVTPQDMTIMNDKKLRGYPVYFALMGPDEIWVSPIPSQSNVLWVEYYPPAQRV